MILTHSTVRDYWGPNWISCSGSPSRSVRETGSSDAMSSASSSDRDEDGSSRSACVRSCGSPPQPRWGIGHVVNVQIIRNEGVLVCVKRPARSTSRPSSAIGGLAPTRSHFTTYYTVSNGSVRDRIPPLSSDPNRHYYRFLNTAYGPATDHLRLQRYRTWEGDNEMSALSLRNRDRLMQALDYNWKNLQYHKNLRREAIVVQDLEFQQRDLLRVESLMWITRNEVMSIKAYEKIQLALKNGTTADDLYLDAFLAKSNTERTHPMHEWFTIAVLQDSRVASDEDPIQFPHIAQAFRLREAPIDVRYGIYSSVFANGDRKNLVEALPDPLRKEALPKSLQKDECLTYLNIHVNAFDLERRDEWLKN
ncbi:hypothetical protein PG984_016207 [Apiospora sp. TS-2023a]